MSAPISYWEEIKRKLVHLSSLWMVAATLLIPQQWVRCALFGALLLLTLISEHDFANNGKYLGRLYGILFGKMLRNEVHPGQWIVSGGAPVLAAALLVNLLFLPRVAAVAMTILLTGDAAAALIGRRWGQHKIVNGKSWEGTLGFIFVGYAASVLLLMVTGAPACLYWKIIPAVAGGALAELFQKQLKLDDNLLIPLVSALILQLEML